MSEADKFIIIILVIIILIAIIVNIHLYFSEKRDMKDILNKKQSRRS